MRAFPNLTGEVLFSTFKPVLGLGLVPKLLQWLHMSPLASLTFNRNVQRIDIDFWSVIINNGCSLCLLSVLCLLLWFLHQLRYLERSHWSIDFTHILVWSIGYWLRYVLVVYRLRHAPELMLLLQSLLLIFKCNAAISKMQILLRNNWVHCSSF